MVGWADAPFKDSRALNPDRASSSALRVTLSSVPTGHLRIELRVEESSVAQRQIVVEAGENASVGFDLR